MAIDENGLSERAQRYQKGMEIAYACRRASGSLLSTGASASAAMGESEKLTGRQAIEGEIVRGLSALQPHQLAYVRQMVLEMGAMGYQH